MLLCAAIFHLLIIIVNSTRLEYNDDAHIISRRALQKSHEKPRIQKLSEFFLQKDMYSHDSDLSLINLLSVIADQYLSDCTTAILYDKFTETEDRVFLAKFFQQYRHTYVHGNIPEDYHVQIGELVNQKDKKCVHFIIFIQDVMRCQDVVSKRSEKVVVIAKSSQWRVQEYLSSEYSQEIANLLIIVKSNKFVQQTIDAPYILYTHKLFVDALGSSQSVVLTSWNDGNFSRNTPLFQSKMNMGFSGHRFIISAAHQPPYVIKKGINDKDDVEFDGIEVKLVELLSKMYNFSTDYKETSDARILGPGEAVIKTLKTGMASLGIGGLYITESRYNAGIFHWHSEDCASFISLASTALPKYRAIMGPFRWTVWLALIGIYLAAIFLFTYSDKATLKHLIKSPEEIENMFWYVFGTFTNSFSFSGKKTWTKAEKNSTKLLIGIYWLFTIIITACYTGSIIAFVTIPIFPAVVDTVEQLLGGRYQIGMLDKGGWPNWFKNMSDKRSTRLLQKIDYVPDVESGLRNVTKAFFWPYSFLGSKEQLSFIVKTNFSVGSKRSLLHISQQCFVPFKVGIILPPNSVYSEVLGNGIRMIIESGLHLKMKGDVEWETLRTATGKLLPANTKLGSLQALNRDDRALTLDDTQGMFLLLAIGFVVGGAVLFSEIFGGCFNFCKKSEYSRAVSSDSSIPSNPRFHERQTNRERHQSISHQGQRFSLKSNDIEFHRSNVDDQFGSRLVHDGLFEISPHKKTPILPNRDSSDSSVDYNEEITKIFSEVLEPEDDEEKIQNVEKDDEEKKVK